MACARGNVLSELRPRKPNASSGVRAWAASVPESEFFLSAVTVLEHQKCILQLERKTPPAGAALRTWFDAVRRAFEGRILPFIADAAMRCARMHIPDPKSYRDSMIAATALEHGFTVVTRNVGDFAGTGVTLLNPWD
ncbi:type II toxin-antitoxin system VapC family toxin [Variovorax humicola]|uniref:Type II toxin-antitoxin system VapC family toxin n=1 Tax=Variovorax humicola TaxID=1769758 RepID=A0ABU8W1Y2_9BURK